MEKKLLKLNLCRRAIFNLKDFLKKPKLRDDTKNESELIEIKTILHSPEIL